VPDAQDYLLAASEALRLGQPLAALRLARTAARLTPDPVIRAFNLAGYLIDIGSDLRKTKLIREGVAQLEQISKSVPPGVEAGFHYNLGNGYSALGSREGGHAPGSRPSLGAAVSHLDRALQLRETPDARTNLAGVLAQQGRYIEALDELNLVLRTTPSHHTALARRGSALMGIFNWTNSHAGLLQGALHDHLQAVALSMDQPVFRASYERAVGDLRRRVEHIPLPAFAERSKDQKWIWENSLGLNPCPLCERDSPSAFDLYPFPGRFVAPRRRPPSSHVVELVNALCRSYATARWLLYMATGEDGPAESDHVISLPGLPEITNNLRSGLLLAAAGGFYAVLGQAAFALDSYMRLGHNPRRLTFDTVWATPGGRSFPTRKENIHPHVRRQRMPPLVAFYGLSESFQHGIGRYAPLRSLRNNLEHHVVAITSSPLQSRYFIATAMNDLLGSSLALGRLARATVWYLSASFLGFEQRRARQAVQQGNIVLPDKGIHVIRS